MCINGYNRMIYTPILRKLDMSLIKNGMHPDIKVYNTQYLCLLNTKQYVTGIFQLLWFGHNFKCLNDNSIILGDPIYKDNRRIEQIWEIEEYPNEYIRNL